VRGGGREELQPPDDDHHHRNPHHAHAQRERQFVVLIVGSGRVRLWSRYGDRASADTACRQLRRVGFDARLGDDDEVLR